MPFFPSPLRDDGYDIADLLRRPCQLRKHCRISGSFSTRPTSGGIRVIIEMVLNHTSDQHPWFQESRSSQDNPRRDWYVWSDTDSRYAGTRIIFLDTETSQLGLGPDFEILLLAPLLQSPARSQLRTTTRFGKRCGML
jgi:maltose alpha-D-glucosyltransferase/alpha-amylase